MARPKHRQPPAERAGRAVPALGAGSGGRRLLRSLSAQDDHRVNAWKRGSELRELFHRPVSLQLGRFIWLGAEILRIWRWFVFPSHTWLLAFERSDAAPGAGAARAMKRTTPAVQARGLLHVRGFGMGETIRLAQSGANLRGAGGHASASRS